MILIHSCKDRSISDSPLEAASIPMNCRIWSWHHHTSYVMEGDVARLWLLQSVLNAPQNWLIEELYMVRCERQCMNLEENQSAKFTKVVTAAEHTRYTLLHCLVWIPAVFLTCLALYLYRSWALLESSICIRGFSANGIQSEWNNPIQQQLCFPDDSEGKPTWELTTRYWDCIVFMSNIRLGVD